jgi:HlyD family secretion protein
MILLSAIAACWFIQYPDMVNTTAKLNSVNAPKEVKTKTDGKLVQLFVTENKNVQASEILGFIESRANHTTVLQLSTYLDTLSLIIIKEPENLSNNNFSVSSLETLGELQSQYQVFQQALLVFKQYLVNGFYTKKKKMLQQDLMYMSKTYNNLLQQKQMQEEDLSLQQETFDANEKLKNEKVISALDYRNEKSKLIGKKMSLPQITSSLINIESSRHEKQKEIAELDNQIAQQKNIFTEALNSFKAQVNDWKAKYLLIAPVAGKVAFASFIQENQQLNTNQIVCFINPGNSAYYAEIHVPQYNFGKINIGQKVMLKFPAYPYEQYGFIEGTLDFISNIPTDSGYLAKVGLPQKLITNYGKQLQFYQGLSAQGEIVTQDMRLLERFFYQAKSVFSKK